MTHEAMDEPWSDKLQELMIDWRKVEEKLKKITGGKRILKERWKKLQIGPCVFKGRKLQWPNHC